MRMILQASLPVDVFNAAIKDGSAAVKMQRILAQQKPEAAYFSEFDGVRTAFLVVEVATASQIPAFAEPWFLSFDAKVQLRPAMTAQDLGASGLDALGKEWA